MITKVLFLCVHNSARSQMAEAYLKKFGGSRFTADSAGLEKGTLSPLAIAVMQEEGIDISNNQTTEVFAYLREGKSYNYVITVCDAASSDSCPIFPGMSQKIHWDFQDPSKFMGTQEEKLAKTRIVRDKIKKAVLDFIERIENED